MGAEVTGLGFAPDADPSLFQLAGVTRDTDSEIVDLGDSHAPAKALRECDPEMVFHMARADARPARGERTVRDLRDEYHG
jgi:CDP-glucose 4,6-dehydratase